MRRDNPFEKIEEMLERMDQEFGTDPFGMGASSAPVDVRDAGDEFVVTAELPGFEKEDIEVTLADRTLRIDADRDSETATEGEYIRRERRRESTSRSVHLPEAVAEEGIEASHSNGVLTVTLPKQDAEGGTQIDIE
ncbi:MAG: Hsp20/alpha crystallin family protein [Halobacteriales archaeon]